MLTPVTKHTISQRWLRFRLIISRIDFIQLIPMLLLLFIGVLFIYGTGQQLGTDVSKNFWVKQIQWIIIGSVCWLGLTLTNYRALGYWSFFFYLIAIILLILVLIPSIGLKIYGARRWIQFPGIRVQPSEFAKFAVLLLNAWILSLRGFEVNKLKSIALLAITTGIPFTLILLEPDLGSSLVLVPLTAILIFVAGIRWKLIVIAIIIGMIALPTSYFFVLRDYQKKRIKSLINPEQDIKKHGWQQYQAGLAVGSGGVRGKGFMQGTQSTLGFIPQTHTDFIFSVIAEETGFVGSISLLFLYLILLGSALRTSLFARDPFGRYLAAGIAAIIFSHSLVNIGMNIRLMPVTGLPLPLVSYGGSFIVSTMIYLGILQSIHAHRKKEADH